ncbi:hypothetical protein ABL78_6944 [Leptomonas seymouri]|uniref:Uncharacterized protein n=1 Tax=Leptomonas seymouri TaxID=5684 RepID=A0A0N1HUM9_LEPSE|nr:hypothetical protein ABL78_6944 [Leptomonas seymouri]|eukprot:KPI84003.1 hypothetical protein ABL78_6944 [Leptomonas seymouri]
MTTAGLSRAYAVLRQLDVLRTDEILHPLSLPSAFHIRKDNGDASQSPPDRSPRYHTCESRRARRSVESDGRVNSPPTRGATPAQKYPSGLSSSHCLKDGEVHENTRPIAKPKLMVTGGAPLMPPPPAYSGVRSGSPLGSTTSANIDAASRVLQSEGHVEAHASASSASAASNFSAPPLHHPGIQGQCISKATSILCGGLTLSPRAAQNECERRRTDNDIRSAYNGHVYMRHSPKSSPHRTRVLSPVVLPGLSTSEADYILSRASLTLEDYFDRDDMPSVMASVAAAARGTGPAGHRLSVSTGAALSSTSNSAMELRDSTRGPGMATSTNGAAVLSSLSTSTPAREADDGFYAAEITAKSARRGRPQSSRYNVTNGINDDSNYRQDSPRWKGPGSSTDRLKPIIITQSAERILEAVQMSTQYSGSDGSDETRTSPTVPDQAAMGTARSRRVRDTYAPSAPSNCAYSSGLDERFSPIQLRDSPTSLSHEQQHFSADLSSFFTAAGRMRDEVSRLRDSAVQTTAISPLSPASRRASPIRAPISSSASDEDPFPDFSSRGEEEGTAQQREAAHPASLPVKNGQLSAPLTEERRDAEGSRSRKGSSADDAWQDEESATASYDGKRTEESRSEPGERGGGDTNSPQTASFEGIPESRPQSVNVDDNRADRHSPDFPPAYTDALPFLGYLARVNAATADVLLKELAAMGDAWEIAMQRRKELAEKAGERSSSGLVAPRDEDEVVDCLALGLLLNKPAALQHIAVPLLRAQLKNALRELRDDRNDNGSSPRQDATPYINDYLDSSQAEDQKSAGGKPLTRSPASAARAASFNSVLCSVIGLGGAASTLLPLLLQLLLQLPPPRPNSICDFRLVGLAIRTSGAAEGLCALTRIVEGRTEAPHVLTAAAYAISTYAYELPGHTSVMCVPAGTLQRSRDDALYRLVPGTLLVMSSQCSSTSIEDVERELCPLWSGSAMLSSVAVTNATPTGTHVIYTQSPPPYQPTHMVIDAEAARQSLQMFIASEVFRVRCDHPYLMVLLDDALNSSLLCPVLAESSNERIFKPIWDRMRRNLHHLLCNDRASTESTQDHTTARGLQQPLLLYSIQDFFADEKDMIFALESALVHALVSRSAPIFQEQALLTLSALPPEARVHVVQALTDFFLKVIRRYELRHSTTMRRASANAHDSSGSGTQRYGNYGDAEGAAEEAVVVAAVIAASTACANPLTPEACTSSCIAVLTPVLMDLLHSSQWRVRHAACIGLARVGPYTADPPSIVDLFVSLFAPSASSSSLPNALARECHEPTLLPATIAWCLAQQQQGGVRALLLTLQNSQESPLVRDWCAFQLAGVDVYEACQEVDMTETPEADALLDEMVQVLGKLIATQGALEEDTMLLCVRALAEVVHRAAACVDRSDSGFVSYVVAPGVGAFPSPTPCVLPLQTVQMEQEAATYYECEPLNSCFTALTSVMEAALLPANVVKALCLYLCKYGGAHGELYVCEMLLEGTSVAARAAAAFGLRACGAKVIRSVVLAMNDASFEVRRESLDTMDFIGAANVLAVLHHRPAEHRHQVLAALRDGLLQDAGRSVTRKAAETVYRSLARDGQGATPLLRP